MLIEKPIYCPGCSRDQRDPVIAYKVLISTETGMPDEPDEPENRIGRGTCDTCGRPVNPWRAPNRQEIEDIIQDQRETDRRRQETKIETARRTEDSDRIDKYL